MKRLGGGIAFFPSAFTFARPAAFLVFLSAITVIFPTIARAIDPEVEKEIASYKESDLQTITNGRALVLEHLRNGNREKAKAVVNFLEEKYKGKKVLPFWLWEEHLLRYWTGEYEKALKPNVFNNEPGTDVYEFIVPPRDLFMLELQKLSREHREPLLEKIVGSDLQTQEKDFLRLLLGHLERNRSEENVQQALLNAQADEYLKLYPESPYNKFIRRTIRVVFKETPWGLGMDLGGGYGHVGGQLNRYFEDELIFAFGFDVHFNRIMSSIRAQIGGVVVGEKFDYNGTWKRRLKVRANLYEMSLGYVTTEWKWLRVGPFAGLSQIDISPNDSVRKEPGNDVKYREMAYTIGWNTDILFKRKSNSVQPFFFGTNESRYWGFRLRYGYSRPFSAPAGFGASYTYADASFVLFGRGIRREE